MNEADQYGDRSSDSPPPSNRDEENPGSRTPGEQNPWARPASPAETQLDSFAQLTADIQWGNGQSAVAAPPEAPPYAPPVAPPAHRPANPSPSVPAAPQPQQQQAPPQPPQQQAPPPQQTQQTQQPSSPQQAPAPPARQAPPEQPTQLAEDRAFGPESAFDPKAPSDGERGYDDPKAAIHDLLKAVVDKRASDLHLIAGTPPLLRVHGDLENAAGWRRVMPKDVDDMIRSILPEQHLRRLDEDMELDCAYSVPDSARFRVNIYWQRGSMAAAFRIIPYNIQSVEELGLPKVVNELSRLRRGLIVVTGPTGSGKSTTLAAMVDIVNHERMAHILTVEDPIEFLHKHGRSAVSQREVGPDTHGFAPALKHALRQDPDVILVGEMRDLETISTAITAAETGHLVFATLHTQDAPQTIDRIIDVFPPSQQQQIRIQLAITLQGVVAQQLLPTVDGQGRVAAAEVLVVTPAVRNLIREGKTHQIYSAMQAGRKFGMTTMDAALATLVGEEKITQAVAVQNAYNIDELQRLMGVPIASSNFGQ